VLRVLTSTLIVHNSNYMVSVKVVAHTKYLALLTNLFSQFIVKKTISSKLTC